MKEIVHENLKVFHCLPPWHCGKCSVYTNVVVYYIVCMSTSEESSIGGLAAELMVKGKGKRKIKEMAARQLPAANDNR